MKTSVRLITFVSLLLLVTGMGFLSACNALSGGPTSELESRITKLETAIESNGDAIAQLQLQVGALTPKAPPIVPPAPPPALPPASPPPVVPPTPPPATAPPTPPSSIIPTARITLGNLTITPASVKPGEVVTVSIEVKNTSTITGIYKVVLVEKSVPQLTSDLIEYSDLMTLAAGETKTATFTTSKTQFGTYSVEIGTKVGQYAVIDPTPPPPPPPPPSE